MARWMCVAAALVLAACATEGGAEGGSSELPNRGVQPYVPVSLDDDGDPETEGVSWVLRPAADSGETWTAPSAVVVDDVVVLAFAISDGTTSRIVISRSDDLGVTWSTPQAALDASGAPELGDELALTSPALLAGQAGAQWLLAFEYGQAGATREAIGLARSADGVTWTADTEAWITPKGDETEVAAPSILRTARGLEVFYEATLDDGRRVVRRAIETVETDDEGNERRTLLRSGTVLAPPAVDCIDEFTEVEPCWDRLGVAQPEVRLATRRADGSQVYRMWYTGFAGSRGNLGFAASEDGQTWSRFPINPVVDTTNDVAEPTNVFVGGTYLLMYFDYRSGDEVGLSLAINELGAPSEVF